MLYEFDHNFALFWLPNFLRKDPQIFDQDYKIEHTIDHVAKFEDDRPRELKKERKKRNRSKT